MQRISCHCSFELAVTGVTGNYRATRLPFTDLTGTVINTESAWHHSRNRQRNWETLTQLIAMRTQLFDIHEPQFLPDSEYWFFEFTIEGSDIFRIETDDLALLKADCENVPMLLGLDKNQVSIGALISSGAKQNIWFVTINDK